MLPIIALGGYKGAGKDAVADYLVATRGWRKVGVSDAITEHMLVLNPYVPVDGGLVRFSDLMARVGFVEAKRNQEFRRILDTYGSLVARRLIADDIWVQQMVKQVNSHLDAGYPVVVTGIGFPSELDAMKRMGAHTVWVNRPGVSGKGDIRPLGVENFDQTLENDGSRTALFERIEALLDLIPPHG